VKNFEFAYQLGPSPELGQVIRSLRGRDSGVLFGDTAQVPGR
jgi:hypothetical protein